jgi:glycosyltransferase involved in cell wall biosynthesis
VTTVPTISICIPTYNRAVHLVNCLESLASAGAFGREDVEVCISDNGSTDGTWAALEAAQSRHGLHCRRNATNMGIPRNFLDVVAMATGEFVWLIGDDDLVLPSAIDELVALVKRHKDVDYFFVNASHLTTEFVLAFPQPFDTANLPGDMTPFSSVVADRKLAFLELIDPEVSFDFLGGMFLALFRRTLWLANTDAVTADALLDSRTFSLFENTFPHVAVFAQAFSRSRAYLKASPVLVCLTGAREWAPMYPMVRSVRLLEALDAYRRNGLPLLRYLRCRNFALRTFIPDLVYMRVHWRESGWQYIRPFPLLLRNAAFPNTWLSVLYYVMRKFRQRLHATLTGMP